MSLTLTALYLISFWFSHQPSPFSKIWLPLSPLNFNITSSMKASPIPSTFPQNTNPWELTLVKHSSYCPQLWLGQEPKGSHGKGQCRGWHYWEAVEPLAGRLQPLGLGQQEADLTGLLGSSCGRVVAKSCVWCHTHDSSWAKFCHPQTAMETWPEHALCYLNFHFSKLWALNKSLFPTQSSSSQTFCYGHGKLTNTVSKVLDECYLSDYSMGSIKVEAYLLHLCLLYIQLRTQQLSTVLLTKLRRT